MDCDNIICTYKLYKTCCKLYLLYYDMRGYKDSPPYILSNLIFWFQYATANSSDLRFRIRYLSRKLLTSITAKTPIN